VRPTPIGSSVWGSRRPLSAPLQQRSWWDLIAERWPPGKRVQIQSHRPRWWADESLHLHDVDVIEHREPTAATVRYLYGINSVCAEPTCREPLYRVVEGLPRRVLNSTVAHIHARRENGPRWDVSMSEEANRLAENLLVLCRFHSAAIDEFEEDFPPETLRSWKANAESPGTGVDLSDEEVATIVEVWTSQSIHLQAETITLGGSLGGGGGAIGFGAFGGSGGDITQFPELRPIPRKARPSQVDDLGKAHVPGFDGQPGGPSAVSREDGEVLLAVGGGGGGFVGSGARSTDDRIGVSVLMFANSLDVRDGLVFVLGGAWQTLTVATFPEVTRLMVLVVIEAGQAASGEFTIHVDLHDPAGSRMTRASFPLVVDEPGAVIRVPLAVALEATFAEPGQHHLTVSSELGELASVILVVLTPEDPTAIAPTKDES
jgi:hypothetical protein